jgi:universal stress protein A
MASIRRILCPVDFSDASRHAIDHGVAIARWYHASITALHVARPTFGPIHDIELPDERVPEIELKRLQAETAKCFERAKAAEVDVDVVVEVGQPAARILERSRLDRSDLIVMGVHGRNAADVMLFGSTTNQVVRRATCPVLTMCSRDSTAQRHGDDGMRVNEPIEIRNEE